MRNSRNRVFNMLKRIQNLKYRLVLDSLIVGGLVGLTIVAHRLILNNISPIFLNLYKNANENYIFIVLVFLLMIVLGYLVGKCVKKEPMISGSGRNIN